ncbi:hypothetical protein CsSME_00020746 [Camellia sinensis var. sinensis]
MIFTKLFKHFNINLKGEEKVPRDPSRYGAETLRNMGYSLINQIWTKTKKPSLSSSGFSTPGSSLPSSSTRHFSSPDLFSLPDSSDISSLSLKIDDLDSLVQGPLFDGIASINSRLNNLNLGSTSLPASNIPSFSHTIAASSSSAMEEKIDELSALLSTGSKPPMKNFGKFFSSAGTTIWVSKSANSCYGFPKGGMKLHHIGLALLLPFAEAEHLFLLMTMGEKNISISNG